MGADSFLGLGSQEWGSVHQRPGGNHLGEAVIPRSFPEKAVSGSCRWFLGMGDDWQKEDSVEIFPTRWGRVLHGWALGELDG